jgi:proteasome lid subunit RPN8/RPN11
MEHGTEIAVGRWNAPECPFQIEYATRVLDDIRLAVVDAFFSLPRGGAEIGGLLLGKHEIGLISITDFEPLDCEHAMGPSFTLSPRDQALLADMTARARRNATDRQPLGWYHSHTRSEIFLSETDQDIHKRFFPEPWQVALVLKPHTFEPTRGGFFFRDAKGAIRGAASYQEFVLEPLPMRPVQAGSIPPIVYRPLHEEAHSPMGAYPVEPSEVGDAPAPSSGKKRVPITREAPAVAPFEGAAEEPNPAAEFAEEGESPQFTQLKRERSWRAVKAAACLALGLAAGIVGYQTRDYWLPRVIAKIRPLLPKEPPAYLSLSVSDSNGQMNIHWDANSPSCRNALEATLEITDGNPIPRAIRLDEAHLALGSFTYSRESERVDVTMIASQPSGQPVKEQTSFFGKLPETKAQTEDPKVREERDALAEKADKLQKDFNFQAAKTRKLEKDLKDMKAQLDLEQRRRLAAQSADPAKKNQ